MIKCIVPIWIGGETPLIPRPLRLLTPTPPLFGGGRAMKSPRETPETPEIWGPEDRPLGIEKPQAGPKIKIELNDALRIYWEISAWEKVEKLYRDLGLIKIRRSEIFATKQRGGVYVYSYTEKRPSPSEHKFDENIRVLIIDDLDDYRILHVEPAYDYNGKSIIRLIFNFAIFRVVPLPLHDSEDLAVAHIDYDTYNIYIPYQHIKQIAMALATELKIALRNLVDPKKIKYKIAMDVI